jgi:hypothetical protein
MESIPKKTICHFIFDRQKKLQDIEFIPDLAEYKWQKYYNLAQKYYEYYHNLLVPLNYKTKNGYEYNINGYKLGQWLAYLRNNNNELSKKQKNYYQILPLLIIVMIIFGINIMN